MTTPAAINHRFQPFGMINEQHNPWKIKTERVVYDNPWIEVTDYQVINPSGGDGIYGKVHFKNLAVGVIALDEDHHTWLVGQFRFVLNQYSWEIPEGGSLTGTDPLESAKRELMEETGLEAAYWKPILQMHLSNSVSDELAIVYLARQLKQGQSAPEETEELAIRRLPFEEVYQMVSRGEISDSITVATALKVKLMLLHGEIS